MQTINKSLFKNTLTYTWFAYPIAGILMALLWLWAFPTFHDADAHRKLSIFLATDVTNQEFAENIKAKYNPDILRKVNLSYALPNTATYSEKLRIALSDSDILILTRPVFESYEGSNFGYGLYFVKITDYIKEQVQIDDSVVYNDYSIRLKNKGENHYLENYMTFADEDYVICFSQSSQNLGTAIYSWNGQYTNAFSFVHYLLEGE